MTFKKRIPAKKYYTPDEILDKYDLSDLIGDDMLIRHVTNAFSKIPMKIADRILNNFYFFTNNNYMAKCIGPSFLNGRGLIFISSRHLKRGKQNKIEHTIIHEAAHYILKHSESHGSIDMIEASKGAKHEREANLQVKRWLEEYEMANPISKLDESSWNKELLKANGIEIPGR